MPPQPGTAGLPTSRPGTAELTPFQPEELPSHSFLWILKQRLTTWSCVIFRILNLLSSFHLELPSSLRPNLEQHISFCHILEPMGSLRRSLELLTPSSYRLEPPRSLRLSL